MKRLLVAVVLLALTAGLCVGSQFTLERGVDRLLTALEEVDAAYRTGGQATASVPAEQFVARFSDEARWFPLFLKHERIEAAKESVWTLPALLEGDRAAFEAELTRCRRRLEELRDSERLTVENLL